MKREPDGINYKPYILLLIVVLVITIASCAAFWVYRSFTKMIPMQMELEPFEDPDRWTVQYRGGYDRDIVAREIDGALYLDARWVNENVAEDSLFLDTEHGKVDYTTAANKRVYTPDEEVWLLNGEEQRADLPAFRSADDGPVVLLDWVKEQFGLDYAVNSEYRILAIYAGERYAATVDDEGEAAYLLAYAEDGSFLRSLTGDKTGYEYYRALTDGETVVFADEEAYLNFAQSDEKFVRVITQDGLMGYLRKDALTDLKTVYTTKPEAETVELPEERRIEGPVVLAWHQNYSGGFADSTKALFENADAVNVISPTWFKFDENGTLLSCANADYVQWAHEEGYQVWALFDNDFDDAHTNAVLQEEASRTQLIEQLLDACGTLGLDGINVDFEALTQTSAPYFIEFLRELSVVLRGEGYVLSVDVSVPQDWSSFYRRDLMARCCDYVMVMGYDEHYAGCGEAGSVASWEFTEGAVRTMLSQCPPDKLILGMPFYTRQWASKDGTVTDQAYSMESAEEILAENQAEITYDETARQDYGRYELDGTVYEIWLENEKSLGWRIDLAQSEHLGGVAVWKIGMERPQVWELFENYLTGGGHGDENANGE